MRNICRKCGKPVGNITFAICDECWNAEFPNSPKQSQGEKREYITCAANWFNDGKEYLHQPTNIKEGFVVCGHRHHNVFMTVSLIRGEDFRVSDYGKVTQGFLTSHDRFVDREEAGVIAFREKQITKWTNCLFSEDLY